MGDSAAGKDACWLECPPRGPQAGRRNSWGFAAALARRAGIRAPPASHTD